MTPSQKLLTRLRSLGVEIPEGATIRRTYAGTWQKAQGANVWHMVNARGDYLTIGSQFTVTELNKAKNISASRDGHGDINVDIEWSTNARGI